MGKGKCVRNLWMGDKGEKKTSLYIFVLFLNHVNVLPILNAKYNNWKNFMKYVKNNAKV